MNLTISGPKILMYNYPQIITKKSNCLCYTKVKKMFENKNVTPNLILNYWYRYFADKYMKNITLDTKHDISLI